MKWVDRECQITDDLYAGVWRNRGRWEAYVNCLDDAVWVACGFDSESAAKAAVASWIGKTIAQLGNALAAGEQRVDEDNGA